VITAVLIMRVRARHARRCPSAQARVGEIRCRGLIGSVARLRHARTHVAYESRDSGGGAMGLRLTLGGMMTIIAVSAGGAAGATCAFHVCGDVAQQEPQPHSKACVDADTLAAIVETSPSPCGPAWLVAISTPQSIPADRPSRESSNGSNPEQPRHQTVTSPVNTRRSKAAAVGRRVI
jgi:hypothetical protein